MEVTHPKIQEAAMGVEAFCSTFFKLSPGKKTVVLIGDTGVGKTMMAEAIFNWARRVSISAWEYRRAKGVQGNPPGCEFWQWSGVCAIEDQEWKRMIHALREPDLLILDDVGSEVDRFKTGEHIERLRLLLNVREDKWNFITTNIPQEKWAEVWDARVEDRLLRGTMIFNLNRVESFAIWSRTNK